MTKVALSPPLSLHYAATAAANGGKRGKKRNEIPSQNKPSEDLFSDCSRLSGGMLPPWEGAFCFSSGFQTLEFSSMIGNQLWGGKKINKQTSNCKKKTTLKPKRLAWWLWEASAFALCHQASRSKFQRCCFFCLKNLFWLLKRNQQKHKDNNNKKQKPAHFVSACQLEFQHPRSASLFCSFRNLLQVSQSLKSVFLISANVTNKDTSELVSWN